MNSRLGINLPPDGDDPHAVASTGAGWVRLVLKPNQKTREICEAYKALGIKVLVACDADTEKSYQDTRSAALAYWVRCGHLVDALQVGSNEFEGTGKTSSTLEAARVVEQMRTWVDAWRERGFCGTLVGAGLVSGDPLRWHPSMNDEVQAIAVHPYTQTAATIDALLAGYRQFKKPLWITEFEWNVPLAKRLLAQADVPVAFVYCWQEWFDHEAGVGWDHGLLDVNGNKTIDYHEFVALAKEASTVATKAELEAKVKLLEQQQGLTVDLVARVLSGKWDEGVESAEALLQAIAPEKYGTFQAVKFPKA